MKIITTQLIAEKKLLSDPSRWTKGHFARDANGLHIDYLSKNAVCWCQFGAAQKIRATGFCDDTVKMCQRIKTDIVLSYGFGSSIVFNDHPDTTHEMLMKFYDDCIGLAKSMK